MRILHLDIETAPNTAHVWGLFKQNVALSQLRAAGYVICWAAKWDDESEVRFAGIYHNGRDAMLRTMHGLLNEADMVVTYNGRPFDVPWLNAEFARAGLPPPRPFAHLDLLNDVVRRRFRLPSYKLEFVAEYFGVGRKMKHEGHALWVACVEDNDARAWDRMRRYNMADVRLQARLYRRLLGWVPNHPNRVLHGAQPNACPTCGSGRMKSCGIRRLTTKAYRLRRCQKCGAYARETTSIKDEGAGRRPTA